MHEERVLINLTYKAIVPFTRIAANVHIECPTNVELYLEERETICDLKKTKNRKHFPPLLICPERLSFCRWMRVRKGPFSFPHKFQSLTEY